MKLHTNYSTYKMAAVMTVSNDTMTGPIVIRLNISDEEIRELNEGLNKLGKCCSVRSIQVVLRTSQ